ncbi:TerD family protein [Fusobacterium hwasookii]|uniref:TerD family protein n=1 Tax=Fusobacterium hwasookii TaxID=1583098 RepID=UPI0016284922|nr:TerD family protein [Fusobacterium hwasookii]QNE65354.1 TerD family protein [Fusobacterium hwasookii]
MNNSINSIALRHFNGIYIAKNTNNNINVTLSIEEFATLIKKFEGYGYIFSKELAIAISKEERNIIIDKLKAVIKVIEDFKSDKNYTVFYKNFPDEVINMSEVDLYINQILHYWIGYLPSNSENVIKEDVEPSKLVKARELNLIDDEMIEKLFIDLLSSNVTLSEQYLDDVCVLTNNKSIKELEKYMEYIQMKETLTAVSSYILKKEGVLIGNFKTTTDILRLIAKISGDELNNKHILFAYFSRTELSQLMTKLENLQNPMPDIKRYSKPWHTFFKLYAKKINFNKYPKVKKAVDMLFGDISYMTERGKINEEIKRLPIMSEEELDNFVKGFTIFYGDYVREILSLLNKAKENQYEKLLLGLENCVTKVNTRILFQLYDRIINLKAKDKTVPRLVNSKGKWRRLKESISLSDELLNRVLQIVEDGIKTQLKEKENLGKIFIDEDYKNIMLTTSEKDSNVSLRPMTRGSRIKFNPNAEVLRFFVAWKNLDEKTLKELNTAYSKLDEKTLKELTPMYSRVDVDLSALTFNENLEFNDVVAYYNQKKSGFAFSGDITNAPEGALEYIDIFDLERLKKKGNRYILMQIRSYNGYTFEEINSVYAGVMELTSIEAKEKKNMYSTAITEGFQIVSSERTTNTILVDLKKFGYIWLDMNMDSYKLDIFQNALNYEEIPYLNDMLRYFSRKQYITMYDLLRLNADVRGVLTKDKKEADVIFEKVDNKNNLALADILSNYL